MSGSITAATAATTGRSGGVTSSSRGNGTRLAENFDTFLTLLTTQLRNQSPTDPLDANEMTAQLVQFASVEQQMKMNSNLDRLVSLQQATALTAASPLLGQQVEVESDRLSLQGGVATVVLPGNTGNALARVQVLDANGRPLRESSLPVTSAGATWRWDGRDANGRRLPDGAYHVAVTGASSTAETARALPFTVRGTATGAEQADGTVSLALGGLTVGFDRLRRVLPAN